MSKAAEPLTETLINTRDEEYQLLLRSLRRRKGFGLLFVESTPVGSLELIAKIKKDLSQKNVDVLSLENPIINLIEEVKSFPEQDKLNILFITGLEKSLVEYIRPGYGGKGDFYNLDTIPPILSHLNWQRENFRDRFRHLCFVFIVPKYAIKYLLLRAPDFFDWGSGLFEIATDRNLLNELASNIMLENDYTKYCQLSFSERKNRIVTIENLLKENLPSEGKASFLVEKGRLLTVDEDYQGAISCYNQALKIKPDDYNALLKLGIALADLGRLEEAIAFYDHALKIKPDIHAAWLFRGYALADLGRLEEAIASYDHALKIKPDIHAAWLFRGYALGNLGKIEEAIVSHDNALKFKPDDANAYYNKACAYGLQGNIPLAIKNLQEAINLDSQSLEDAKIDTDFDKICHDSRFINLINQSDSP
jgi:tetratricopeptide (TPR) repeat protein